MSRFIPNLGSKLFITMMVFLGIHGSCQALAASGNIMFNAYLLPNQANATVEYPQTIVSFSSQVLLPMPANMNTAVNVRVHSGGHSYYTDSQLLSVYRGAGEYGNFHQIELRDGHRQQLEVCEIGSGRCVIFNIVRAD